jgi:hypothetical protein
MRVHLEKAGPLYGDAACYAEFGTARPNATGSGCPSMRELVAHNFHRQGNARLGAATETQASSAGVLRA